MRWLDARGEYAFVTITFETSGGIFQAPRSCVFIGSAIMTAAPDGQARSELLTGWRVLLGATVGLTFGVQSLPFYTAGLFINALNRDLGWSLEALSFGTTLLVVALAVTAPVLGYCYDRFGERKFILPGLLIQAAGLLLLSRVQNITAFYMLMGGMALLGAGCASPAYVRIVNRNFHRAKGTALGIMITGAAALSALVPPLLQGVISDNGWRTAYLVLAIAVLCATPVILILLRGGERTAQHTTVAEPAALAFSYFRLLYDRTFFNLAAALFLVALACPGLLIHFSPMLTKSGATAQYAAWMMSVVGMSQVASRLTTGVLVDRFFAPRVATALILTSAVGFLLFWNWGVEFAIMGAIAAGLAYGAEADLLGYFTGRYYPQQHFGRVFSIFYVIFLVGTAASPALYGWIVSSTGSYSGAVLLTAVLLAISSFLFALLPRFTDDDVQIAACSELS